MREAMINDRTELIPISATRPQAFPRQWFVQSMVRVAQHQRCCGPEWASEPKIMWRFCAPLFRLSRRSSRGAPMVTIPSQSCPRVGLLQDELLWRSAGRLLQCHPSPARTARSLATSSTALALCAGQSARASTFPALIYDRTAPAVGSAIAAAIAAERPDQSRCSISTPQRPSALRTACAGTSQA